MIEKKVDFDTTFKRADDALYSAKQKGKNRVETYSP
jgi:PleD family two-component response regulator